MTAVRPVPRSEPDLHLPIGRTGQVDPFELATTLIAYVAVLVVGFDQKLVRGISGALVLGVVLVPLLWTVPRQYPLARLITVLSLSCVVSGLWLGTVVSADHRIDSYHRIEVIAILLGGLSVMVLVLWGRLRISASTLVVLYGLGGWAGAVYSQEFDWKFNLVTPTAFIVLGVLERFENRLLPAVAIVGVGITGVVAEARSLLGFCLLAATLTIVQLPRRREDGRAHRWFPVVVMVGLGLSIYLVAGSLLTSGYLGTELQQRSEAQVEATGSLIAGGRPEWAATRELVKMRPLGFGAGVVPDWSDLEAGRSGLTSINIDTGGYVNNYMFGGQFRLHSVASDLWVNFGLPGVALAATVLFALLRSLSTLIAERRATTSAIFASSMAIWFLFFGPMYTNWTAVCFAVGLTLLAAKPAAGDRDPVEAIG
jgi:hypothetical protein